jgi:SH2 domain
MSVGGFEPRPSGHSNFQRAPDQSENLPDKVSDSFQEEKSRDDSYKKELLEDIKQGKTRFIKYNSTTNTIEATDRVHVFFGSILSKITGDKYNLSDIAKEINKNTQLDFKESSELTISGNEITTCEFGILDFINKKIEKHNKNLFKDVFEVDEGSINKKTERNVWMYIKQMLAELTASPALEEENGWHVHLNNKGDWSAQPKGNFVIQGTRDNGLQFENMRDEPSPDQSLALEGLKGQLEKKYSSNRDLENDVWKKKSSGEVIEELKAVVFKESIVANFSREEAEDVLSIAQNGAWLIRTESENPSDFIISLKDKNGRIEHYDKNQSTKLINTVYKSYPEELMLDKTATDFGVLVVIAVNRKEGISQLHTIINYSQKDFYLKQQLNPEVI